jgi:hypothetical protein
MAGLTKDAVVQLILQHIGGSKIQGAGQQLVAGAQEVIVKASGLSSLTNALKQFGSTVDQIRSNILANPQLASIKKALSFAQGVVAKVNSLNIPQIQKDQLLAAASGITSSLGNLQTHTDILSGTNVVNPFSGIEASLAAVDNNTLADAYIAATEETKRIKLTETLFVGGAPIRNVIKDETTSRINGDNVITSKIDLIGSVNANNSAFVINTATTYVSNTVSLAQSLTSTTADIANVSAKVSTFADSRVVAGKAYTQAVLSLDSNGYIGGLTLANDGSTANVIFTVDNFTVVRPGAMAPFLDGDKLFEIGSNGIVKMHAVEVDTLKNASVTPDHLIDGVAGESCAVYNDTSISVTSNTVWTSVATTTITPNAGKPIKISFSAFFQSSPTTTNFRFRIIRNDTIVYGGTTGKLLTASTTPMSLNPVAFDTAAIGVAAIYAIQIMKDTDATPVTMDHRVLMVEEQIRLNYQDFQITAAAPASSPIGNVPAQPIILRVLSLSPGTIAEAATVGTVVGSIFGLTDSSTFSLTNTSGGHFALSGNRITVASALSYATQTAHTVTVQENITGSGNGPKNTSFTIIVVPTPTAPPPAVVLNVLSLSKYSVREQLAAGTLLGTVSGTTSGSTLSLFAAPGSSCPFTISGTGPINIVTTAYLDFATESFYSIILRETKSGVTKDNQFDVNVTEAPVIYNPNGPRYLRNYL